MGNPAYLGSARRRENFRRRLRASLRQLGVFVPWGLLGLLAGGLLGSAAQAHHPDHLACQVNERRDGRLLLRACAHAEPLEPGEHGAHHFLEHHAAGLGLQPGVADLLLVEERQSTQGYHTRFQQTMASIPVYDSFVSVNQGSDGALQSLYSDYRQLAPGNSVPELSAGEAEAVARAAADVQSTRLPTTSELMWYPRANGSTALVWKSVIYSETPLGDFLSLVDAHTGKLLLQENRIAFDTGSGFVYSPNPIQTSGDTALVDNGDAASGALNAELENVTLQGLDPGVGTLKGEYVDLVSLPGGKAVADADEASRVYAYDRSDPRFEQVVIYHAIDSIQRYFHSLGFDDHVGAANGIRDFPTLAHAHWYDQDQSFYSTGDDAVHFGDGGVDDGEDGDIIAHEYGHAIQHDQNSCWGGGEMGAMGEGFGDYLAASFYADAGDATYQASHAACVGDWDAVSYSSSNPPCLRRVDGDKQYPTDLTGSVHADGEIWSRALWDIRAALGAPTADQLVLEHHFHLPCSATMPDAAAEILQADGNLNGGANGAVIRQAFCARGILSGQACAPPSDLMLTLSISPDPAQTGQPASYTLVATNTSNATVSAISLSASVPSGSSYVAGSASDGGSESGGTVSWPSLNLAAGAQASRSFQVLVAVGPGSETLFADDMEAGPGSWAVSHAQGSVDWTLSTANPHNSKSHLEPVYAKSSNCAGGTADVYPCNNVDLLAYRPMASIGGGVGTDGWGWTDPQDGKEYVLHGRSNGTSFLDISDPADPIYLGDLPTQTVNSDWRDMKVYADHAFIVSEASGHGMQVFDLTQLRSVGAPPVTFSATAHYAGFSNAHNIAINTDSGFAYAVGTNTCSGGLHIVDIRTPTAPLSAGCYSGDGYTHDVQCVIYTGPDSAHNGKEICLASNEDTLTVVDVTNKSAPLQLSRTTYAGSAYSHQGWLTEDQRYFLMDDELDEQNSSHNTRTYVWDVSDLDAPVVVGSHTSDVGAIDHNLYVVGDLVYQANYRAGLRILKIEDPGSAGLCELGYFDVYPADDASEFNGAWNVYPFFSSGVVAINAIEGLALVRPQLAGAICATPPPVTAQSWFASDPSSISDQYLGMTTDVGVSAGTTLSFWHDYQTENSYDGGVVEYSSDSGSSWTDLGPQMTQNGYSGTISGSFSSPISNRSAFEGNGGGYQQTQVDLSAQAGQDIRIRFRMASDTSVSGSGWYVDDVHIGSQVLLSSVAQASGGASQSATLVTEAVEPPAPPANNPPQLAFNTGLSLAEGATATIGPAQLRATDADVSDVLTFTVTSGPAVGSLSLGGSFSQADIDAGNLSYTHDGSEQHADGFSFTLSDGNGGSLPETSFSIAISAVNDPPSLGLTALPVSEAGQPYSLIVSPTDPDPGDSLSLSVVSGPAWLGSPVANGDGTWTLAGTPGLGDVGSVVLTIRVTDDATPPASDEVSLPLQVTEPPTPVPALRPGALLLLGIWIVAVSRLAGRRGRYLVRSR